MKLRGFECRRHSETEMVKEREGGAITAQTYKLLRLTTLAFPIKTAPRASTGYRLWCYCSYTKPRTAAFKALLDNTGGFTVCQHHSLYLNHTDLFELLKSLSKCFYLLV